MLKNKIIVKKVRNIAILLMAIIIMIGAYKNIDRSRAEDVIEIGAIALDNYGYLQDEEFMIEAVQKQDGLYEIELPEIINTKKINQIINVTLEDLEQNKSEIINETEATETLNTETVGQENLEIEDVTEENLPIEEKVKSNVVEIENNKIILTELQMQTKRINIEVAYDMAIVEKNEQQEYNKVLLSEKSNEEIANLLQKTEETQIIYNKILTHEDKTNGRIVEIRGFFPKDTQIQVQELSQQQVSENFQEKTIDFAYDIKVVTENEIIPKNYGETCEVYIKDERVKQGTEIYKKGDDNNLVILQAKENTEGIISFDTDELSVYGFHKEQVAIIKPNIEINSNNSDNEYQINSDDKYGTGSDRIDNSILNEGATSVGNGMNKTVGDTVTVTAGVNIAIVRISTSSSCTVSANTPLLFYGRSCSVTFTRAGKYYIHLFDSNYNRIGSYGPYIVTEKTVQPQPPSEGEDTTTPTTPPDTITPTISIKIDDQEGTTASGGENINKGDGSAVVTADQIGKYVTNYESSTYTNAELKLDSEYGWKIFYGDGNNIYLIADDFVPAIYAPNGKGGTDAEQSSELVGGYSLYLDAVAEDYAGLSDIRTDIKNKWLSEYVNYEVKGSEIKYTEGMAMKKIAYLLDANVWSTFTDDEFAEYAVGAPTLELFAASYNMANPSAQQIEFGIKSGSNYNVGYGIFSGDTGYVSSSTVHFPELKLKYDYNVGKYYSIKHDGFYIASPIAINKSRIWTAARAKTSSLGPPQLIDATSVWWGIRPVICLKNGYVLESNGDDTYKIVKLENDENYEENDNSSINGDKDARKTWDVDVIIQDTGSGLASGIGLQYAWSESNTTEPTSWNTATIPSYTAGTTSEVTVRITGIGYNGKRYLWIKPNPVKDVAGNANETIITTGEFLFDNQNPVITITPETSEWRNTVLDVSVSAKDIGVAGLRLNGNEYQYCVSNEANPDTLTDVTWETYNPNGTTFTLNPGTTGIYYIFVKNVSDAAGKGDDAGNTSTTNGTPTTLESITYQRFGPYYFDYDGPEELTYINSSEEKWTNQDVTITANASDAHSGVQKIEYSYDEITWYSDWNIDDDANDGQVQGVWTEEINTIIYFRTIDNVGNISEIPNPYTYIRIDKTSPYWEIGDVTRGSNDAIIELLGKDDLSGINASNSSLTTEQISVYVDGELVNVEKTLSSQITITEGIKYNLTLNLEQPRQSDSEYKEYSGTIEIKIAANTLEDNATNKNIETEKLSAGFIDVIKPDLMYKHQEIDISQATKTYIMTFDVTDKYYGSEKLTLENGLKITMTNGQLDANGEIKVFDLEELAKQGKINLAFNAEPYYATPGTQYTNLATGEIETVTTDNLYQIGHTYTLKITGLDQLIVEEGNTTANYSGVITVEIDGNVIKDRGPKGDNANPNVNDATTINSGVDIVGGTENGNPVDIVSPVIDKISSSAYAFNPADKTTSIGTITFKVTDTYYVEESTLTTDDIEVWVNGSEATTGINKLITATEILKEDRIVNSEEQKDVQYGVKYTLEITGWAQNANQVKIKIPEGKVVDQYGNGNKEKEFIIYNTLILTDTEYNSKDNMNSRQKTFLGENDTTRTIFEAVIGSDVLERQYIEKVIFVNNTEGSKQEGVQKIWDVSAQGDDSILAWYSAPISPSTAYTVYIGSDSEIFANQNSTALFNFIGRHESCIETETIKNLHLLNTSSVTNMDYMFWGTGSWTMTSFELGNFDTRNVSSMVAMFAACGGKSMTSLDLGDLFDTSNVINMKEMFDQTGQYSMITLDLGDKFDTSNVTNMHSMFELCGQKEMTNIYFGTTEGIEEGVVVLPDNFNTSRVTTMYKMFENCGYNKIKKIDLGNNFYTTSATNMAEMFYGCGNASMEMLDLGPVFTKIASANADFVTNTGKSGCVIYAPEAIYLNTKNFKASSTDTTTITYTQGTINPKYRTEWYADSTKVTVDKININNSTIEITLRGQIVEEAEYTSDIISTLKSEDIKVFIDNTKIEDVDIYVGNASEDTETDIPDILQTIKLSNFNVGRLTGKEFQEWSGNITLEIEQGTLWDKYGSYIDGNNEPVLKVFTDESENYIGNANILTSIATSESIKNEDGKLFVDFIKPEFTYTYSESDINHETETVIVNFDVIDKYFKETKLTAENIKVLIDDYDETEVNANIEKQLTKTAKLVLNKEDGTISAKSTDYIINETLERCVGEKYELKITELDQENEEGIGDGFLYSGYISLVFPSEKDANTGELITGIIDHSGNINDATTISIGLDENDGNANPDSIHGDGTIVDVVDPVWKLVDVELEEGIITIQAQDEYFDSTDFNATDITVIVDGNISTVAAKQIISGPTPVENGVEYQIKLSDITSENPNLEGFIPTNNTNDDPTDDIIVDEEGKSYIRVKTLCNVSIKIASGTIVDQYNNTSVEQTLLVGIMEANGPAVYDIQKIQDPENNQITVIFNVTDRNYDSSDLVETNEIELWMDEIKRDDITITSLTSKEIKGIPSDTTEEVILGHQYTLVLSDIVETQEEFETSGREYKELSGTLQVKIAPDASKNTNGKNLDLSTTTISDFIDYIKPEITQLELEKPKDPLNKTYTMSFKVTDKYLDDTNTDTQMVQEDEITIYIDGEEVTAIKKPETIEEQEANKDKLWMELTSTPITVTMNKTVIVDKKTVIDTDGTYTIGHEYILVLSNFEQSTKQTGKNFMEWSGTVTAEIEQESVNDKNRATNEVINTLDEAEENRTIIGEQVDFIKPVVEKNVESIRGTNTETIVIDVIDKYLDTSDSLTEDEITVYIDDEEAATITKVLTKKAIFVMDKTVTPREVTLKEADYIINDAELEQIVGERYELVLSGFEQTSRNDKDYKDWSGTVRIDIAEGAVRDKENVTVKEIVDENGIKTGEELVEGGNVNEFTQITGNFVDFVKPDFKYVQQTIDKDTLGKPYTITFNVTDKYYANEELTLENLLTIEESLLENGFTITMTNGQLDSNGEVKVYDLKTLATQGKIDIALDAEEYYATPGIKYTNLTTGLIETTTENTYTIGHTYTLTITGLDQLVVEEGNITANYSGVITVGIGNLIKDKGPAGDGNNPNVNDATTINSGVDIPGGEVIGTPVDVVDPIINKVSSSAYAFKPADKTTSIATITFKVTDTYYVEGSTLTTDDIEVLVNGDEPITEITKTITETEILKEDRILNGERQYDVQYGVKYTLEITGWAQDANQVKIKIPAGKIIDQYENGNKEKEFIIYNTLRLTETEHNENSKFLGEDDTTETIFEAVAGSETLERQNIEKVIFVNSIAGSKEAGVQKIWDVSAQRDDSILAWYSEPVSPATAYTVYIGSDSEIFANQNSKALFSFIGFAESCTQPEIIKNLNLLNTSSVTNMSMMFRYTGHNAMENLDLSGFDTHNVYNMQQMFNACGEKSMETLNLGDKFDTSNVTNMQGMFEKCGYENLTNMYFGTTEGIEKGVIELPDNFNTSRVTDMQNMFKEFGDRQIQKLDLGNKFYTTSSTNMSNMFNGCGKTAMSILDLGPAFTKISSAHTDFVTNTGKSGCVIYAPEAIYLDENTFKASNTDATTIPYSQGTINLKYRTEWYVDSTNATDSTLEITLRGQTLEEAEYTSPVTSTLKPEDIEVWIEGTKLDVDIQVGDERENTETAESDILQTITLSNFNVGRLTGKDFQEWSGNITLKIAQGTLWDRYGSYLDGNNQPVLDVFTDASGEHYIGNANIAKEFSTSESIKNPDGTDDRLFADFIKPEFTYTYFETDINYETESVMVKFNVIDKYFKETKLTPENIKILVDDYDETEVNANIEKQLTKTATLVLDKTSGTIVTKTADYTVTDESVERMVGEQYELIVSELDQETVEGPDAGFLYSGYMSIVFPGKKDASTGELIAGIIDHSGNVNDATTITIGLNEDDGYANPDSIHGTGVIVDVVDPVWKLVDVDLDNGIITIQAQDEYFSSADFDINDVTVIVNDDISTKVVKEIISGPELVENGVEYKIKLSNITPEFGKQDGFVPTNNTNEDPTDDIIVDEEGKSYVRIENGGRVSVKISEGTIKDQYNNKSVEQTIFAGIMDATIPAVYEIQKIQDSVNDKTTIVFNITDKNYDPSDLVETSELELWMDGIKRDDITITSLTSKEIKGILEGTTKEAILGHQYTLVLSDIVETQEEFEESGREYKELSGTLEVKIAEDAAKDINGNTLVPTTTTISDFIDYIKPEITQLEVENPIDSTNKTYTMSFKVTDKYLDDTNSDTQMIQENEIVIYIDGEIVPTIPKPTTLEQQNANKNKLWMELTSTPIEATMNKTVDGTIVTGGTYTIGHEYTLVLSNFEQSKKQTGKNFMEWSGTVMPVIVKDAVNDKNGATNTEINKSAEKILEKEHVDFIKPVVEKNVESIRGTNTETIVIDVIDKYLDISDSLTEGEITVYVDEEEASTITKVLTKTARFVIDKTVTPRTVALKEADYQITDTEAEQVVGERYELVLSGFEQTARNDKDYKDWSGTVSIEIAENAVKDTSDNKLDSDSAKRTITGNFVDFIKPDLEYISQSVDKNSLGKPYTMTFDVTDKYYESGELSLTNGLTVTMTNGQLDANGNVKVFDLEELAEQRKINLAFNAIPYYATPNTNRTNASTGLVETIKTSNTHQIGHTYTLTITGLDQLMIEDGNTTVNYSGVITVGIDENIIKDRGPAGDGNNTNVNDATTINSGVNIPGGTGNGEPVDAVNPLIEKVSSSAYAFNPADKTTSIGTITFKVTDTYYVKGSTLTTDDIEVWVNGSKETTGINKVITETKKLEENRIVNGVTQKNVQYGVRYTLEITGWAQNAHQVKIKIPEGKIIDKYGNGNLETDLIIYNTLRLTETEYDIHDNQNSMEKQFLGETSIQRQYVEQVVFENSTSGSTETGVVKVWDVSAQQDNSIIAWTSQTEAPYTVHIGSNDEIFANQISTALFSYIGFAESCSETETIKNLNLLNTSSVTKMDWMFNQTGADAMTSLNLGNFDTINVNSMIGMFTACGKNSMTSLDLGNLFDTSNVTNMQEMFCQTGYGAMLTLDVGDKFDTSQVISMSSMFEKCGYQAMTNIYFGTTSGTEKYFIKLPDNFNTSRVTDMQNMFKEFGYNQITKLDLGDKFYTTSATNMSNMFNGCGQISMRKLDLGPVFTKIATTNADFATNTGKSGCVIHAPEAIYSAANKFKASNTDIPYTQGTINPKYRTEWYVDSTDITVDTTNINDSKIEITLKGQTLREIPAEEYTSDVVSTLKSEDIEVWIDGTKLTGVNIEVGTAQPEDEVTSYVEHIITLSNFNAGRLTGEKFQEWSGNIELKIAQGTLWDKYGSYLDGNNEPVLNVFTDASGNYIGNANIKTTLKDTEKLTSNTDGKLFADFIKPEFTYTYSESDINHETETVIVVFDVIDKYFASTTLSNLDARSITVRIDDYDITTINNEISKQLEKVEDLKATVNGVANSKIGERYKLTLTSLDKEEGFLYSGYMSLSFANGTITDKSGIVSDATTIAIGLDEDDGNANPDSTHGDGTIVDVTDPIWKVDSQKVSTDANGIKQAEIVLQAVDKYFKTTTLTKEQIQIIVNGANNDANITEKDGNGNLILAPNLHTNLTGPTNITNGHSYKYTISNFEELEATFVTRMLDYIQKVQASQSVAGITPYREYSGPTKIEIPAKTVEDIYGNFNDDKTILDLGIIDILKPEIVQISAVNNIATKTQTITFVATDKYFDTTDVLNKDTELTVKINGEIANSVTKTLTSTSIKTTVDGTTNTTVGYLYTLVLSGFEEVEKQEGKSFIEWSGNVTVDIAANALKDKNNNNTDAKTLIGKFVDYVQPKIEMGTASNNISAKTQTITFRITDKYLNTTDTLNKDTEITVKINGETASSITKTLTSAPVYANVVPINGLPETATNTIIGYDYTLVLSGFEQDEKQSGKDFIEWSGNVAIEIATNALTDKGPNGDNTNINGNEVKTLNGVFADFIAPKIENLNITNNVNATNVEKSTQTITFTVTDKYLHNALTDTEIQVLIDEETPTRLTKTLTSTPIKANVVPVNGSSAVNTVVGYNYTLVLSNFQQSRTNINRDREFTDWSGTVKVTIPEGVITDKGPNGDITNVNKNEVAEISKFADFIKPDVSYEYFGTTDINYDRDGDLIDERSFKMEIDVTDKYMYLNESNKLTLSDFDIKITSGQLDNNGRVIIHELNDLYADGKIDISFRAEEIKDNNIKMTTDVENGTVSTVSEAIVGYKYIITLLNLDQVTKAIGEKTVNYSGVVTVVVSADQVTDKGTDGIKIAINQKGNGNESTSITSGINVVGGTVINPDSDSQVVDLVKPIWEITRVSKDFDSETTNATIYVQGTDTYFDKTKSGLENSDIKLYAISTADDGTITKTEITSATAPGYTHIVTFVKDLLEDRIIEGKTIKDVQYGVEYKIEITNIPMSKGQVKFEIIAETLEDQYGNKSEAISENLYNTLKVAKDTATGKYETSATSLFLGNPYNIKRQDIENITFLSSTSSANATTTWDVSDAQDESILAWYTGSGPYQIYIASDEQINANMDSSYLFSYIGYDTSCRIDETGEIIKNINLLKTENVKYMNHMFQYCGYQKMKTLDLGSNFKTKRVTDMSYMFRACGYTLMETLKLGSNFDTSNVTNMSYMFRECGVNKIKELNLGENFKTAKVTNMNSMFYNMGYNSTLTTLNLGGNFDTSKVRTMNSMFNGTGNANMTQLILGEKFNTSKVTDMYRMFYNCGQYNLTSLDLGNLFYTTSATIMTEMFNGCGKSKMTTLDLGPAFTNIPEGNVTITDSDGNTINAEAHKNMFVDCGKSTLVIYAPEAIYETKTGFKTGL